MRNVACEVNSQETTVSTLSNLIEYTDFIGAMTTRCITLGQAILLTLYFSHQIKIMEC